jgi:glucan-binding YG repeat protein
MQIQVINLVNLPPPSQPTRVLENANPSHQPRQLSTTKSANQSVRNATATAGNSTIEEESNQKNKQHVQCNNEHVLNNQGTGKQASAIE